MDALILAGVFDMCCLNNLVPTTAPLVKAVSMLPLFRKDELEAAEPSTRDNSDEVALELPSPKRGK